jgi:RNA polymerase sigma-70 factor (ECF subfamily)
MERVGVRSEGVTETETLEQPTAAQSTWARFEALYRSSRDDVFAYVTTLLGDRSAAEDVTALAFERAYRRRVTFDRRRGDERAWVFGIARNAALDELRRLKRRAPLESEPADVWSPGPDEQAERAFERDEVRAALATLDSRDRDLVALKFAGGLSNGEIARVLGISETNVGSRLYRAVAKLRKACQS